MNTLELQELVKSEQDFIKFIKKALSEKLITFDWKLDSRGGFKLELPNTGYIRIKFVDAVKILYNSKNVELPGTESSISCIDVSVMSNKIKGYAFVLDYNQHRWTTAPTKALEAHLVAIEKLKIKASNIGCDLSLEGAWTKKFTGVL